MKKFNFLVDLNALKPIKHFIELNKFKLSVVFNNNNNAFQVKILTEIRLTCRIKTITFLIKVLCVFYFN